MQTKTKNKKIKIMLVDPDDKQIGTVEKLTGHRYGMLHRAFSVCIFRKHKGNLQFLLQQRSKKKYHGGGLWTNTCCSHAKENEPLKKTAENNLLNEMGISLKLTKVGKFHYIAKLDQGMTENEIDHVFVGMYDNSGIQINPEEVDNYKWIDIGTLKKDLKLRPKKYTPWLKQALDLAVSFLKKGSKNVSHVR